MLYYKKLDYKVFAYTVNDKDCHIPTLKPINDRGYVQAYFSDSDRKRKKMYLHRVAFAQHFRIPLRRRKTKHICGNPACFNPEHIDLLTYEGALVKGATQGSNNVNAKITEDIAKAIYLSTDKQAVLAERYGVSVMTVGRIKRRQAWITVTHNLNNPTVKRGRRPKHDD